MKSKLSGCKLHRKSSPHAEKKQGTQCENVEPVHDVVISAVDQRMPNTKPDKRPCREVLQIRVRFGDSECAAKCVKQDWDFEQIFEMFS